MPGKTPIWGNPMRERERERSYYSVSRKYISAVITQFPAKRKTTYSTQKFLPRFPCHVRTVVQPIIVKFVLAQKPMASEQ